MIKRVGIDYPELVVFDLDACLWDQEMYEMSALPSKTVEGDLNGTFCVRLNPHSCFRLKSLSFPWDTKNRDSISLLQDVIP